MTKTQNFPNAKSSIGPVTPYKFNIRKTKSNLNASTVNKDTIEKITKIVLKLVKINSTEYFSASFLSKVTNIQNRKARITQSPVSIFQINETPAIVARVKTFMCKFLIK
jgi:hypothetical protein